MVKSILMVGVGGQGTILTSKILSEGLLRQGYDVKMCEIHGMAQRGGSVTTQIKFGDRVYSTCVGDGEADVLVAFEKVEAARYLTSLKPNGTVVVNDFAVYSLPVLTGAATYPEYIADTLAAKTAHLKLFNANRAAAELGNEKVQNMIVLGMVVKALGLEESDWESIIKDFLPEKLHVLNIKAYKIGLSA